MEFGTELKLKKEWKYNNHLTFEKGDTFKVALYEHKYGTKLYHPRISNLLDFKFNWMNKDIRIEEYFEVIELEVYICTDFELNFTNMKKRKQTIKQPINGNTFTIIIDKGK